MNENIHPLNVPGNYHCTYPGDDFNEGCIQCGLCPSNLPEVFREDEDGYAYVHKQPTSEIEIEIANELILDCPTGSIGKSK